jgi:hypothetical protein
MGGEGLGGLGDVRAAAVHKEIYGAQRVFSAPGEKKDLQGTPSRDRDLQGMGSHTDWGCPESQGASAGGWACHVTGGRVSVSWGACHVLTVTGPRRRSLRGESLGEDQEISQGVLWSEFRESCDWAPRARAWRRGGWVPPAPARGDCPLVPTSSAAEPTCVTSMTHIRTGLRGRGPSGGRCPTRGWHSPGRAVVAVGCRPECP